MKIQTKTGINKNKRHKFGPIIKDARTEKEVCGSSFEEMLADQMREEHGKEVRLKK